MQAAEQEVDVEDGDSINCDNNVMCGVKQLPSTIPSTSSSLCIIIS